MIKFLIGKGKENKTKSARLAPQAERKKTNLKIMYRSEKRSRKGKLFMAITLNKEYRFINKEYSNMALNVYGTSSVSSGKNVCLYNKDADPNDEMQRWKYQYDSGYGNRLHCMKNTDYVLDRSSGMTDSCANNAHTYEGTSTSAEESAITFVAVSGETDVYKIRLTNRINNEFLFLTAANNNGTLPASAVTSSTLTTANKNVCWATEAISGAAHRKQCWEAKEYTSGGSSSGGGETGGDYCWPTEGTEFSRGFSDKNDITKHDGVDIKGSSPGIAGDEVYAYTHGCVSFVGTPTSNPNEGYTVRIHHNNPLKNENGYARIRTQYMHLNSMPLVNKFDEVQAGDLIGYMGNTGNSTGVHLHFEIRGGTESNFPLGGTSSNGFYTGTVIDPTPYLELTGVNF